MRTLNLLVLRCRDIKASRHFYESLGMRFSRHAHGSGPEHFAHEDERGVFELYPAAEGPPDRTGLGFGSSDLDATFSYMCACGYDPQPVRVNSWGRTFVVRDPDGRRVEIKDVGIEHTPDGR
jgi:catechol 2,3-dioxygenase-like lactoylglutathione lyase family enzyme